MTAASEGPDFQKLFEQVAAVVRFAQPLAERLLAAGSLDGALQVGQKIAVEGLLNHGRMYAAQAGVVLGSAGPQDAGTGVDLTGSGDNAAIPTQQVELIPPQPGQQPFFTTGAAAGLAGIVPSVAYAHVALKGMQVAADFARDYVEVVQRETTKRQDIVARRDIRITELELARETLEQYLKATFDERRSNFQGLFKRLDVAQAQGDVQGMQMFLASILDLAKSSPFKDMATFKRNLERPDFVLEL